MKKSFLFLLIIVFLIGCGSTNYCIELSGQYGEGEDAKSGGVKYCYNPAKSETNQTPVLDEKSTGKTFIGVSETQMTAIESTLVAQNKKIANLEAELAKAKPESKNLAKVMKTSSTKPLPGATPFQRVKYLTKIP